MGSRIHILIVGTGAVGAFYGSRLHDPSRNRFVSLVCRSNYNAVSRNGVHLKTHSFGEYHFQPFAVFNSISSASEAENKWDYVVVTTKALPDVLDDSKEIVPVVTEGFSSIVLIQNGVGVEEPHRKRFPRNPILSAVTVVSAAQVEPGVVVQNRWTRISIGPFRDGGPSGGAAQDELEVKGREKTEEFVGILRDGGIKDAESYDEVGLQLVRWHKIAINASMNPSAVLSYGTGNSRMSLDPELRIHLKGCMEEVFSTAPKILGRPFPTKLATSDAILRSSERNTSGKPSMLLDWEAGRPMELEVILGNPVRIARRNGVEMPRLQSLYALLKMAQTRRKEEGQDKPKPKL